MGGSWKGSVFAERDSPPVWDLTTSNSATRSLLHQPSHQVSSMAKLRTRDCPRSSPNSRPTAKPILNELSTRRRRTESWVLPSSRETSESSSPSVIGHGGNCTCWCNLCCRLPVQRKKWKKRKQLWRLP